MQRLQFRIHPEPDLHAPVVLDRLRSLHVDLGLIYGSPILKSSLFQIPRHGTLGIHHGKLPEYRGKKTLFWAMYHGEKRAGVTIQRINEGLDTGEVVREGLVDVRNRRLSKVWRDIEDLGYDLYLEAIHDVRTGTATFVAPEGRKGKLFRDPTISDLITFYRNRWTGKHRDRLRSEL
jgi:methionyl-tRNA formyltransferase